MLTSIDVKRRATELGFDVCGVAPAEAFVELGALADWLARGYAGEMIYLHKSADTRGDIRRFLPGARSVIVTGTVYNTASGSAPAVAAARPHDAVHVARYARGDDYHVVLGERLDALVAWMHERHVDPFETRIFVDKHHVQERVYAAHAGVGWIGKNTCVINPDLGSWLLLAGVATTLDLAPDAPAIDQCGSCSLCIEACPTGALVETRVLDATRCIAYLTIELEGPVPEGRRGDVGTHLFGCDVCQDVCPWNLAPAVSGDEAWRPRVRDGVRASDLWQRTDQELNGFVRGSAMTHTSLARLRRNLALVIGNSGDASLAPVLDRPGRGVRNAAHSADTSIVREAVAWAKEQLAKPDARPNGARPSASEGGAARRSSPGLS
jgi:epoxyqueuosine reductase